MYRQHHFLIRLLLTVLAVALPLIALHVFTVRQESQAAENGAMANIQARSVEVARVTDQTLARAELLLRMLASREAIVRLDTPTCEELMRDIVKLDPIYVNAVAADTAGELRCIGANRPLDRSPNVVDSAWFKDALADEGFRLSRPFSGRVANRPIAMLSLPLRDGERRKVGVVGLSIDLSGLSETLSRFTAQEGATVALIDGSSRLIARFPYAPDRIGHESSVAWKDARARQRTGAVAGEGLDGVRRLVYSSDVGRYGLRAAAGIPTAVITGPAESMLWRSLGVGLVTLLFGAALAVAAARGLLRPLRSLRDTARAWGSGAVDQRADECLPGAFGTLAGEFNRMIEAREETKALLVESQQRYAQMLDGVDMIALRVRFDGTLTYCNDSLVRIIGWPRTEMLGRGWMERGISPAASHLIQRYQGGFDEGVFQRSRDVEFFARSGETRLIRLNSSVVFDDAGRPDSLSCIGEDITRQREMETAMQARRQAEAANLAKTNFLSRMSHELRTPLNAVLGFSQLLSRSAAPKLDDGERRQLEMIVLAGDQLRALIDDV
ncbi:MAG: hypothetical protein JWQ11_784, partial [Rhizobacter sp.]|nr:hypothetical protein [Rhizobacter sp.]